LATLDYALERLADLAYGPLPAGEKPAPLGSKLLLLALFGVLVALSVASCQLRQTEAQVEKEPTRQLEGKRATAGCLLRPAAPGWPVSGSGAGRPFLACDQGIA
jgi:hypothetical protein